MASKSPSRMVGTSYWPNAVCVCVCVCACVCVCVLVTQSCPTLCNTMDCSPPGSSVHGDSPGKNTGVGCHFLLQRIISTQESNWGLLHCRQIINQLSYQGRLILVYYTSVTSFSTLLLSVFQYHYI